MDRLTLYHYSNKDIQGSISPKYYGDNIYTLRDIKASRIKRAFYYLDYKDVEFNLQGAKYIYQVKVNKGKLYDLRIDKKRYIQKYNTIDEILHHIKTKYNGAIYNIGNTNIAILFKVYKIQNKIKR